SVLLPQFVHPERGSVASQFLWLGVIVVVLGLLFDAMLAVAGMGLGRWLRSHPIAQHIQRWTFAALLIGFGARLALSGRPQGKYINCAPLFLRMRDGEVPGIL